MKSIELNELPESKVFMKHAKIADGLTKETGLEHGFTFCKPKDEIIVDKMCVGTECSIDISPEECSKNEHFFHTHPNTDDLVFSSGDRVASLIRTYSSGKPNIACLKSENNDNIICEKVNPPSKKFLTTIYDEHKKTKKEKTYEKQIEFEKTIHKRLNPSQIIFNSKTKEISSYHYMD